MFEKEAERSAHAHYNNIVMVGAYETGFIDGAEFGYNKAKQERREYEERNIVESEKGKTNKWHDLRKNPNDLPEKIGPISIEVYVAYECGVTDFACYRFDKKCWERSEDDEEAGNVIAWREVPLFKESK